MKKLYLMSILMGAALAVASCNDEVELSSHEFDTVVTFKQEEIISFNFYNVNRDVTQTISINKGGYVSGMEPTITLEPYTIEELKEYNESNSTNYILMPAEYYTLSETSYKFGASENFKAIDVTFKGSFAYLASQGGEYILPICLKTDMGMVNKSKSVVYLKPNLTTPTISTNDAEINNVRCDLYDESPKQFSFEYDFYLDATNEWDFTLKFETDTEILQDAVETFNTANNVNYNLLPDNLYTLPSSLAFVSGENDKTLTVSLDATNLDEGDYLLPIVPKEIEGANFKYPSPMFIHVFVYNSNGKLEKIDLSGRVTASSTHISEGVIENLWDNNVNTKWHSIWNSSAVFDSKYGVYLDINLNDHPLNSQMKFGYTTRGNDNNNVPYMIQIYAGTSVDDLRLVQELDNDQGAKLPQEKATPYESEIFSLGNTAKLIRISFCKTYDYTYGWGKEDLREGIRGSRTPSVCISELELYGK